MSVRPRVWTLATAVVGSLATLALMEVQSLHFAYRAFGLHVGGGPPRASSPPA